MSAFQTAAFLLMSIDKLLLTSIDGWNWVIRYVLNEAQPYGMFARTFWSPFFFVSDYKSSTLPVWFMQQHCHVSLQIMHIRSPSYRLQSFQFHGAASKCSITQNKLPSPQVSVTAAGSTFCLFCLTLPASCCTLAANYAWKCAECHIYTAIRLGYSFKSCFILLQI